MNLRRQIWFTSALVLTLAIVCGCSRRPATNQTATPAQPAEQTSSPAAPGSSRVAAAPQIDALATARACVETMRVDAQKEPWGAVERFGQPQAQQLFNKISGEMWINTVPRDGWSEFFTSAVYTMLPGSDGRFLAMFYHPWSDVVLITLWETQGERAWHFSDLEVAPGDFVRRQGRPPIATTPAWVGQKELPPFSIAANTQQTLDAFARSFPIDASGPPALKYWRSSYLIGQNEEALHASRAGAGVALERNTLALLEFLSDEAVFGQIAEAFTQADAGKLDDVLRTAKDTTPEMAEILRKMPQPWSSLHLASYVVGRDYRSVCFSTDPPSGFLTFMLRAEKKKQPALVRIDVINHQVFRAYLADRQQPR